MKLYLMISWAALEEGKRAARMLEQAGHMVTNHFLRPDYVAPLTPDDELPEEETYRRALADLSDLAEADVAVSMNVSGPSTSGGRHIEFGAALAMNKRIAIIGKPENIFQRMRGVRGFLNVGHLIDGLSDFSLSTPADIAAANGCEMRTLVMVDPAKPETPPEPPVRRFRAEMLPTSEEAPFMVELDATALEVDENGITMLRDKEGIVGVFYPGSAACVRRVDA